MLSVALLADDRQHIYVWPPGQEKPLWQKCQGIFEPSTERATQSQTRARTPRMRRRATTVLDSELQLLAESVAMSHESSPSQLLWQNSKARINVLTAFGVFGTTLAYSTYFQARSGDKPASIVLVMLLTSFVLYLCGTVGSIGLQLAFTDDKPSTLTYMHWLTLPLDFLTCIFMTLGTVTLTQAIAWTMASSNAAFWILCAMGITPFVAVWLPAVIVVRRNWAVIWPAVCDASSEMHDAFFRLLSFCYRRRRAGNRVPTIAATDPPPEETQETQNAQFFLDMYSQYGGALHCYQKMLPQLGTLDDEARADTFLRFVSSLCPQAQWKVENGLNESHKPSCLKFLRLAQNWAVVAEEMHRLSAAPTIKATFSQEDRVRRFMELDKVFHPLSSRTPSRVASLVEGFE